MRIYPFYLPTKESEKDLKLFGIYAIRNLINNKIYVGSASDTFYDRFWYHSQRLKENKHDNIILQRSYNKHGIANFIFEIMEILENNKRTYVLSREQFYIDKYKNIGILFNICLVAGAPIGYKRSRKFCKWNANNISNEWIVVSPEKKIFNIRNLKRFCKKRKLWYSVLLERKRGKFSSKGWLAYRKEEFNKEQMEKDYSRLVLKDGIHQDWVVISPTGKIYHIRNLNKFCRIKKICSASLHGVARGKVSNYKGWLLYKEENYLYSKMKSDFSKINRIKFIITSPDGEIFKFKPGECKSFCIKKGINFSCMRRNSYKGWKIKKAG